MKIKLLITLICVLLFAGNSLAQKRRNLDSLYKTIETSADTAKVKKLNLISSALVRDNPDSALSLANRALSISEKINYKKGIGSAMFRLGGAFNIKGQYDLAIRYYEKSLAYFEELNMKADICGVYNGIGNNYSQTGNSKKAEINYQKGYNLAAQEPIEKRSMAICGFGLGLMKLFSKEFDEALKIYQKVLEITEENNYMDLTPMVYQNLSEIYLGLKNYNKAKEFNDKAIEYFKEKNILFALSSGYITRANILQQTGKTQEAIACINKSYEISKELNILPEMMGKAEQVYRIYKENGDYKNALNYHELFVDHKDSIFSNEKAKALIEAETKFKTKQQESELILKQNELEISESRVANRNKLIYFFTAAILLFIAMLFLLYRQSNERKKVNKILTGQKEEIEKQKSLIETKNKDITDSIQYSRQIQQAIIPSINKIQQLLPKSFIIFKPKDIVSGDFYLIEEVVGIIYLAVIDCTGHGVPGAMLSVFADSTIKNSLASNAFRNSPGALLSDLCFQFKTNLQSNNSGANINDGVDMAICAIDIKENKMYFAGARNGLIRIKNNEVIHYPGNRYGISGTNKGNQMFFEDHIIELDKNDSFYLYTDGFADQFGGPKGKKFKQKQLVDELVNMNAIDFAEQKNILEKKYDEWKGNLEQIDDITLIGFKI